MASFGFNIAKRNLMEGSVDMENDVLRMLLLTAMSTASGTLADYDDLNAFLGDAGVTESSATNYARQTLTTTTATVNDASDRAELDFDDVVFDEGGNGLGDGTNEETIVAAVVYKQVGGDDTTPGDDIPIAVYDIADTQTDGGSFTLAVGSDGAIHVT